MAARGPVGSGGKRRKVAAGTARASCNPMHQQRSSAKNHMQKHRARDKAAGGGSGGGRVATAKGSAAQRKVLFNLPRTLVTSQPRETAPVRGVVVRRRTAYRVQRFIPHYRALNTIAETPRCVPALCWPVARPGGNAGRRPAAGAGMRGRFAAAPVCLHCSSTPRMDVR